MAITWTPFWNVSSVLSVKNTFLDVANESPVETPRSSSVPRSWKPESVSSTSPSDNGNLDIIEAAAVAPSYDWSRGTSIRSCAEDLSEIEVHSFMFPALVTSATGRLAHQPGFVPSNAAQGETHSQRVEVPMPPYMTGPGTPWADVHAVIASAQEAMRLNDHVKQVSLTSGPMGGATGILAEVRGGVDKGSSALTAAKAALLAAAERSETVYVMGYAANPFRDYGDTGFKCWVGHLPTSLRGKGCWDNLQKGFCPRRSSCRWCHVEAPDLLRVVVRLQAIA